MDEDVAYIDHKKIMTHKSLSKFRAMNDHTKIRTLNKYRGKVFGAKT